MLRDTTLQRTHPERYREITTSHSLNIDTVPSHPYNAASPTVSPTFARPPSLPLLKKLQSRSACLPFAHPLPSLGSTIASNWLSRENVPSPFSFRLSNLRCPRGWLAMPTHPKNQSPSASLTWHQPPTCIRLSCSSNRSSSLTYVSSSSSSTLDGHLDNNTIPPSTLSHAPFVQAMTCMSALYKNDMSYTLGRESTVSSSTFQRDTHPLYQLASQQSFFSVQCLLFPLMPFLCKVKAKSIVLGPCHDPADQVFAQPCRLRNSTLHLPSTLSRDAFAWVSGASPPGHTAKPCLAMCPSLQLTRRGHQLLDSLRNCRPVPC
ncbi:hypothetical protein ACRALDRAFT_211500 [Sodiomyces alcalophilus JCM 7366]|uniref:uncharacterized protein n=1 Tax=Sodiomyces alcalophilus JCM 7366 TaxID=591952 RepID=UPI0039B68D5E